MNEIDPEVTLADLVVERPEMAAVLDDLGLDYCCGGQQRLAEAVEAAGGELHATLAVLAEVSSVVSPARWDGLDGLVDHLESTHHVYLRRALPRLEALAEKVSGVHGERHPELATIADLVRELRADLEPHMIEEEQVLFPAVRVLAAAISGGDGGSAADPSLSDVVGALVVEHEEVGELLTQIRGCSEGYVVPDDGCASYRALYGGLVELESDTHVHVHKENNLLFPAVVEALRDLTLMSTGTRARLT